MTVDPYTAIAISTLLVLIVAVFISALYYSLKSKRVRITDMYLSGEPEDVVSTFTPGVMALYWGFMKKFAKTLYETLVGKVHTGSLHDWFKFISSWLGLLLILTVVIYAIYLFTGW